ncbi:metallophosphoesterase [Paenisporosarcina indica]|uniref:metallophosphoesterase n=1 Tax=Paenisporosarcina indica TaxID=650093 RepID=UPI000B06DC48
MTMWKKVSASALAMSLAVSGLTVGQASASTNVEVTRGEYVKSLISAMGVELGTGKTIKFDDVPAELKPYIEKAIELKLIKGKSVSKFDPNGKLNREQAFVIAVRGIDSEKAYPINNLKKFKDENKISGSLRTDLSKGVGMGFLLGYADGTVKPGKHMSKGEMRAIVQRFLKEYKPSTANTTVSLRILGTSDIHTNIVNYDYYKDLPSNSLGLAKTATLIKKARSENSNSLLFDNGDLIQGTPLGSFKASVETLKDGEVHPSIAALNLLDYDVATLGNHEFNYGLPYLNEVLDDAGFPYVNANVKDAKTGKNMYTPYVIVDKKAKDSKGKETTIKVGVTGIVPPAILKWDKSHLEGKVTVDDSVDAVETLIPQMEKAGADVIVVLSHSGMGDMVHEKGEEDVTYLMTQVEGVDAIITGHAHQVFPGKVDASLTGVNVEQGTINGVPVVMPGKFGSHLGVIDLNLKKKEMIGQFLLRKLKCAPSQKMIAMLMPLL